MRKKVLAKHGIEKGDTANVDMTTGEIKEEKALKKKSRQRDFFEKKAIDVYLSENGC